MDGTAQTHEEDSASSTAPPHSESQTSDAPSTQESTQSEPAVVVNGISMMGGAPASPSSVRASTPAGGPLAMSSADSTAGSDTANQLVDTLHIVATDRNAVDKFDLYELFSVQEGFQRIAWQNEGPCSGLFLRRLGYERLTRRSLSCSLGYSFVKFQSHEHAIACLRAMKHQLETGVHDKLNSIKITVAKMSYVPNYKVPTQDDFCGFQTRSSARHCSFSFFSDALFDFSCVGYTAPFTLSQGFYRP
jgi:hypothetical protein